MRGATKNYKFGQKNNWRRTVWNEVLSRTSGRERFEPILYLAGPQDLDRSIAIEKGVPSQNMIAIDCDENNVRSVRDGSAPAILGRVNDVLRNWPSHRPVAAVMLDFCCGLTMDALDVYDLFQRKPLRNAVVMINMMRGRDQWSQKLREGISCGYGMGLALIAGQDALRFGEKHRALQFLAWNAMDSWRSTLDGFGGEWQKAIAHLFQCEAASLPSLGDQETEREIIALVMSSRIFRGLRVKLYSYKSGALTFDSAVFQPAWRYLDDAPVEVERDIERVLQPANKSVARQISAVMAVRTTRIEAL